MSPLGAGYGLANLLGASFPTEPIIPPSFVNPISLTSGLSNGFTHLWVSDQGSGLIQKVYTLQTTPGVVSAIDLSSLGVTACREVRYNNGIIFCCCHDSNKIVLIDANTDAIVGVCTLNLRCRSVTFDGAGNYWVATITPGGLPSSVYKISIADTLAAYPGEPTPIDRVDLGHHIEQISFYNGFVWMSSGGFQNFWATDEYYGDISASLNGTTLSGLSGMTTDMVGTYLLLSRCTVDGNNAAFPIASVIDSTTVTLGSFHTTPTTDGNNGGINWKFVRAQAEPLMRLDPNDLRHGAAASITVSGPNNQTVTISGLSGMTGADVGKSISITGAVGTGFGGYNNNTFFQILSVTNSTTVICGLGSHNVGYPPSSSFNQPVTDTNNGELIWTLVTSHNTIRNDNGYVWSLFPAFGSMWTSNGFHGVNRWDPGANYHTDGVGIQPLFPTPTNPISIISPTNKQYFQCDWANDGTYLWTGAGYGGSGSHAAIRIDPNTNTIIAEVPTSDTSAWLDGVVYDGFNIWVTVRNTSTPGLVRISTSLGSESETFRITN